MGFQVIFSQQAREQLREIAFYLRCNVSDKCAVRTVKEIRAMVESLEEMPLRYALARNIVLKRQGYRSAVCGKYLIFYKVLEEEKQVRVYAIVNGTQDYLSLVL